MGKPSSLKNKKKESHKSFNNRMNTNNVRVLTSSSETALLTILRSETGRSLKSRFVRTNNTMSYAAFCVL